MGESPRQSWVRTAVFLGIGYALVGIVFAVPATHVQAWRLAAWEVSAIGYAAHTAYERFRLRNSPGSAALHVTFAVTLGAFGLAVGANIHSLASGSNHHRQLLLLALGIWPVITALPAFLVAYGTNLVLARARESWRGIAECCVWSRGTHAASDGHLSGLPTLRDEWTEWSNYPETLG